jgi:hypothetical protein
MTIKIGKLRIRVTERFADFHACVVGKRGIWDCGRTPDAAIGALIRTHYDFFAKVGT